MFGPQVENIGTRVYEIVSKFKSLMNEPNKICNMRLELYILSQRRVACSKLMKKRRGEITYINYYVLPSS
jgi:hypothetical protein